MALTTKTGQMVKARGVWFWKGISDHNKGQSYAGMIVSPGELAAIESETRALALAEVGEVVRILKHYEYGQLIDAAELMASVTKRLTVTVTYTAPAAESQEVGANGPE